MINVGQFSIFMEKIIKNIFHDLPYFNANIFSREQIKNTNSAECLCSYLKALNNTIKDNMYTWIHKFRGTNCNDKKCYLLNIKTARGLLVQ